MDRVQLTGDWTYEEFVEGLVRSGASRSWAEEQGRKRYGRPSPDSIEAKELEASALEKAHVAEGDKIVRALGGKVVSFSQPRASKQTPGIPDRRYYFERWAVVFWWEAKAEWGVQSPAQRDFQAMCDTCDDGYILGELSVLKEHLRLCGVCTINPDGSLEPVHQPEA